MAISWLLGGGPAEMALLAALLALVLDAALGDPEWLARRGLHPVALAGRLIDRGERALNRPELTEAARFRRGLALTATVTLGAAAVGLFIAAALAAVPAGWVLEALLASTLIALRGLIEHVAAVARALARSLPEARQAVSHIVGRDPDSLDAGGVARGAIESLAENFSDGVVAPVFWYALLGLPGLAAYKAINTLDSMLGHRTARFATFGAAAARLDDAANLVPARLAGGLIAGAAAVVPGASPRRAWRVMRRDAPRHRSPNAGWQEAALAGALGFALAGPRRYPGEVVDDAWMGEGRAELGAADVRAALRLVLAAAGLLGLALAGLWAVIQ